MAAIQTPVSYNKESYNKEIRRQSERIELLYHNEHWGDYCGDYTWESLQRLSEDVRDRGGQFVFLDVAEPHMESLLKRFYVALQEARENLPAKFNLPTLWERDPHTTSAFLDSAILWQRLCDLLILDDEHDREAVLVLKNVDQASQAAQHDIARLIRFHDKYHIRRTFVFTLDRWSLKHIVPELRNMIQRN